MKKNLVILLLSYLCISGCVTLKESPKYGFNEGYYSYRTGGQSLGKRYVLVGSDSIKVYDPATILNSKIDTVKSISIAFPSNQRPLEFKVYKFRKTTYDIDVISVPVKFRPAVSGFPSQLSTGFNGALYVGYRLDVYELNYVKSALKIDKREIEHHGYSFGIFSGIGTSRIDPYVTLNRIDIEYDGFVVLAGVAGIFAFDRLNFGLALGADFLTDQNKNVWIYQGKPWAGLSIGLNIE